MIEQAPAAGAPGARDPYIAYIHRFFVTWLPVYDLFGASIGWIYRRAARAVGARAGLEVLDVCTGTGEMALRLARQGAQVTGVDVTEPMLNRAREKAGALPVRFELMDARQLGLPDKSFDVAVLSLALHDMPRRVRAEVLREAARVTRDRLVVLDYDFRGPSWWRRLATWLVQSFETAYLTPFVREGGVPAAVAEAGLPAARVSPCRPLCFALYEITLR